MNKTQAAAYIIAQAMAAQIEAMGMVALNTYRISRDETIAYDEKAFDDVILKYGIHHNAIMTQYEGLQDG